jgi:hypothetical protein
MMTNIDYPGIDGKPFKITIFSDNWTKGELFKCSWGQNANRTFEVLKVYKPNLFTKLLYRLGFKVKLFTAKVKWV